MNRDGQNRRQQSGAASFSSGKKSAGSGRPRSMASRMGLNKKAGAKSVPVQNGRSAQPVRPAAQQRPVTPKRPTRPAKPTARLRNPQSSQNSRNPQSARYVPGAARQSRRVTQAEQLRVRRNRTIFGMVCVLIALLIGMVLSVNLLFKITDFRVENMDRSTPANTGIYTEQQIIDLLGVEVGDNLFGFSTVQKGRALLNQLPYLDSIKIDISMPGTVVIKVKPATERFQLQNGNEWLVLSDTLKVLRTDTTQPNGLILLEASLVQGQDTTPGTYVKLKTYSSLEEAAASGTEAAVVEEVEAAISTEETALNSAGSALTQIMTDLEQQSLLDGVSVISLQDISEISFLYQGRVSVKLGTANNLEYKIRLATQIINDPEKGLGAADHGTLDVSYQRSDGEIWGYFQPAEAVAEEPAPEENSEEAPAEGGADENSDGNTDGNTDENSDNGTEEQPTEDTTQ